MRKMTSCVREREKNEMLVMEQLFTCAKTHKE